MRDFRQIEWDEVLADDCRQLVRLAMREDLDRGQDWTTLALVPAEATARAQVVSRQAGVISGLKAAEIVIEQFDSRLQLAVDVSDGSPVPTNTVVATLSGPARSLLTAERTILNFIGRLSGIATLSRQYVETIAHTKARIYDTRKTIPGWRRLEKYAVQCGGGNNHRTGLFDAVLIKDNHIALGAQSLGKEHFTLADAVERARQFFLQLPPSAAAQNAVLEIEVDSLAQLQVVLPAKPDIVLLDNMTLDELLACVEMRNRLAPNIELEASGGVNLQTVKKIAETGVDRISSGALTHSASWLDVGLDWLTDQS